MARRAVDHEDGGRRRVDGMVAGAADPTAKRAKKEKEDPLVRRREELILEVANARVAMKAQGNKAVREAIESLMQDLRAVCTELEAKNRDELLKKLPPELWSKIVDENVRQNDLLALSMTCRFFGDTTKDLGKNMETKLERDYLLDLQKGGKMASHSLGWFRWVFDSMEILAGSEEGRSVKTPVKGAVYMELLLNYAAFQGSVEILRWLMEEKGYPGWGLNDETDWWAGMSGSIEVLEYLRLRRLRRGGYFFTMYACSGAAMGGHLKALKFLRGLDPPCPWDERTCSGAARGGHLDVLKWLRDQDPPCPWNWGACSHAAQGGHLDVLKWARSQDPPCPWDLETCEMAASGGHLEVLKWARDQDPPCPWGEETCSCAAYGGHLDVLKWLRAQNPPCPWNRYRCREHALHHWQVIDWIRQQED